MVAHCLRRWPNIELIVGERLVFAGYRVGLLLSHKRLFRSLSYHTNHSDFHNHHINTECSHSCSAIQEIYVNKFLGLYKTVIRMRYIHLELCNILHLINIALNRQTSTTQ